VEAQGARIEAQPGREKMIILDYVSIVPLSARRSINEAFSEDLKSVNPAAILDKDYTLDGPVTVETIN